MHIYNPSDTLGERGSRTESASLHSTLIDLPHPQHTSVCSPHKTSHQSLRYSKTQLEMVLIIPLNDGTACPVIGFGTVSSHLASGNAERRDRALPKGMRGDGALGTASGVHVSRCSFHVSCLGPGDWGAFVEG